MIKCDSCSYQRLNGFCDNKDCYEDGKPNEIHHIGAYWDEFVKERDKGMAEHWEAINKKINLIKRKLERSMKKKKRSHHEHRKVKP